MRHQVVVVAGGESSEHDVSVASGADVVASLAESHSVIAVHIDRAGGWHIGEAVGAGYSMDEVLAEVPAASIVFPVLHGGWGEGGGIQSELETRGIRFVGSDSDSSRLALSKIATAAACAAAGVTCIPTRPVERASYFADPDLIASALRRMIDGAVVVKPNSGGSSIGVHVVTAGSSLRAALDDVFAQDSVALIQPLISGQEVSIGVWVDAAGAVQASGASLLHLPSASDDAGFTYAHKYEDGGAVLEIPADLPAPVLKSLRTAAVTSFEAMGLRDFARIDFFVDDAGQVVLNEINTIPGLRRASHMPRLVASAGTDYDELLCTLVQHAASREASPARGQRGPRSRQSPDGSVTDVAAALTAQTRTH